MSLAANITTFGLTPVIIVIVAGLLCAAIIYAYEINRAVQPVRASSFRSVNTEPAKSSVSPTGSTGTPLGSSGSSTSSDQTTQGKSTNQNSSTSTVSVNGQTVTVSGNGTYSQTSDSGGSHTSINISNQSSSSTGSN